MAQETLDKKHESKYLRGLFVFWSKKPRSFSSVWRGQSFFPSSQQATMGHSSQRGLCLGIMVFVHFQALTTFALGPQLSPFPPHLHSSLTDTVLFMASYLSFHAICYLLPASLLTHTNRPLSQWCSKNAFRELFLPGFYSIRTLRKRQLKLKKEEEESKGKNHGR